ncbi:fungal protein [Schizosaccharomyces japonicus yFS275]|uniref:Fungal protein n=1 Tax=Schizosaccharomyces japonicus (strain yFS275 / FY16936) TaxID=402676 RepID=B6K699_SCHJY|nr:fungal protein [Schizosaccharomyces japonicus yFS275]EEB09053.2 fungal protein [Schizosaccharomyces japonicus yFS275]
MGTVEKRTVETCAGLPGAHPMHTHNQPSVGRSASMRAYYGGRVHEDHPAAHSAAKSSAKAPVSMTTNTAVIESPTDPAVKSGALNVNGLDGPQRTSAASRVAYTANSRAPMPTGRKEIPTYNFNANHAAMNAQARARTSHNDYQSQRPPSDSMPLHPECASAAARSIAIHHQIATAPAPSHRVETHKYPVHSAAMAAKSVTRNDELDSGKQRVHKKATVAQDMHAQNAAQMAKNTSKTRAEVQQSGDGDTYMGTEVSKPISSIAAASYAAAKKRTNQEISTGQDLERQEIDEKARYQLRNLGMPDTITHYRQLHDGAQESFDSVPEREGGYDGRTQMNVTAAAAAVKGRKPGSYVPMTNVGQEQDVYAAERVANSYNLPAASKALKEYELSPESFARPPEGFDTQDPEQSAIARVRDMKLDVPRIRTRVQSEIGNRDGRSAAAAAHAGQYEASTQRAAAYVPPVSTLRRNRSTYGNAAAANAYAYSGVPAVVEPSAMAGQGANAALSHPRRTVTFIGDEGEVARRVQRDMSTFSSNMRTLPQRSSMDATQVAVAANRNHRASMANIDARIVADSGPLAMQTDPEELRRLEERLAAARVDDNEMLINIGGGSTISPEELEIIARRHVDPMVDELSERAAADRLAKEQQIEAKRAKKEAKEIEKARKKGGKANLLPKAHARDKEDLAEQPAALPLSVPAIAEHVQPQSQESRSISSFGNAPVGVGGVPHEPYNMPATDQDTMNHERFVDQNVAHTVELQAPTHPHPEPLRAHASGINLDVLQRVEEGDTGHVQTTEITADGGVSARPVDDDYGRTNDEQTDVAGAASFSPNNEPPAIIQESKPRVQVDDIVDEGFSTGAAAAHNHDDALGASREPAHTDATATTADGDNLDYHVSQSTHIDDGYGTASTTESNTYDGVQRPAPVEASKAANAAQNPANVGTTAAAAANTAAAEAPVSANADEFTNPQPAGMNVGGSSVGLAGAAVPMQHANPEDVLGKEKTKSPIQWIKTKLRTRRNKKASKRALEGGVAHDDLNAPGNVAMESDASALPLHPAIAPTTTSPERAIERESSEHVAPDVAVKEETRSPPPVFDETTTATKPAAAAAVSESTGLDEGAPSHATLTQTATITSDTDGVEQVVDRGTHDVDALVIGRSGTQLQGKSTATAATSGAVTKQGRSQVDEPQPSVIDHFPRATSSMTNKGAFQEDL